jgi:long-chain acyl-CoA synthetase
MESLPAILTASAEAFPEKPALVFRNRPIPYSEVDEWVRRSSAGLQSLGLRSGDRVALLVGNVPEFLYAYLGTLSLGCVAVPLDIGLTAEELGYALADCEARVVAVQFDFLPPVLAIRERVPSIDHVLVVGPPPTPRGTQSFDDLLDHSSGDRTTPDVEGDDLAVITYTGGSGKQPRGVMLTHGNLLATLDQVAAVPALNLERADVVLMVLPLHSFFVCTFVVGAALRRGITLVLVEGFDSEETIDLIQERGVTALFGTSAMFRSWLEATESPDVDLSPVRQAISTVAPLPMDIFEAFHRRVGVTIWSGYGLPETGAIVSTTALGQAATLNTIGLPVPDIEIKLVDERGDDVEEGDPGEMLVRGPSVSKGYWNSPEETEAAFMDGWFRTGDLAYADEDGHLFLVGHKKDVIRVSGFNVFPAEVEDVLAHHPKVAACTVSGIPDEGTGEGVKAIVTLKPGENATEEEIIEYGGRFLARFKWPVVVEFIEST